MDYSLPSPKMASSPVLQLFKDIPSFGKPWDDIIVYTVIVLHIGYQLSLCMQALVMFYKHILFVLKVVHFLYRIAKPYWAGGDILMPGVDTMEQARIMVAENADGQSMEDEREQVDEDDDAQMLANSEHGDPIVEESFDHTVGGEGGLQHNLIVRADVDDRVPEVSIRTDSMHEQASTITLELQQGVDGNVQDNEYNDEQHDVSLEDEHDKISDGINAGAEEICFICMETIGEPQQDGTIEHTVTTKCGHSFGSACLATWLQHDGSCPMCRRRSPMDDEIPADDDWQADALLVDQLISSGPLTDEELAAFFEDELDEACKSISFMWDSEMD